LHLSPELQLLTRNSPLWQPAMGNTTHMEYSKQLKLLQGLGSLLSSTQQRALLPHKNPCHVNSHQSVICFNHNEWWPWLQTTWETVILGGLLWD